MRWIEFSKIQKFWVGVKICLKMEIFNHSESAKDEIWQNPEYLSRVENLVKKWDFWPLRICKYEIGQNPEYLSCVENLAQKLSFLTTSFLGRLKFGKIQKFSVGSKNLIQIEIFWPLWTWDGWNLTRYRYFESSWKFGSEMRFSTTLDLQRMNFGKIQEFSVTLKIWFKRNWGSCLACPCYFKDERGILSMPGLSPTTNTLILDRPARFLFLALIQLQNILMKLSLTRKYPLIETLIYPTLTGVRCFMNVHVCVCCLFVIISFISWCIHPGIHYYQNWAPDCKKKYIVPDLTHSFPELIIIRLCEPIFLGGPVKFKTKDPLFQVLRSLLKIIGSVMSTCMLLQKEAGQIFFSFQKMEVWAVVYLFCFTWGDHLVYTSVACPGGVLWVLKHPAHADPEKKKEEEKKKRKERKGKKEKKKKERKGEREGKKGSQW